MRKPAVVLLLTIALLLATVGMASAITNGEPDGGEHPYVGLLVFDILVWDEDLQDWVQVPAWRCSGALIAPDVVLTAGHCTDGAVAARVWFDEMLQDEDGEFIVPDYPGGGVVAVEGSPHTNPDFCIGCGGGLPGFALRDVGVVVLDEPVFMDDMAELPEAGYVDTLKNKTDITVVGYGVTDLVHKPEGGEPPWGPPVWAGLRNRLTAPSQLVSGKFVHSDEFIRISMNHSKGKGGTCFGDSGGPDLIEDTILAVNSYVTNYNCAGVGYSSRVDIQEVLDWIYGFMP